MMPGPACPLLCHAGAQRLLLPTRSRGSGLPVLAFLPAAAKCCVPAATSSQCCAAQTADLLMSALQLARQGAAAEVEGVAEAGGGRRSSPPSLPHLPPEHSPSGLPCHPASFSSPNTEQSCAWHTPFKAYEQVSGAALHAAHGMYHAYIYHWAMKSFSREIATTTAVKSSVCRTWHSGVLDCMMACRERPQCPE